MMGEGPIKIIDFKKIVFPSTSNDPKSCSSYGSLAWQKSSNTEIVLDDAGDGLPAESCNT